MRKAERFAGGVRRNPAPGIFEILAFVAEPERDAARNSPRPVPPRRPRILWPSGIEVAEVPQLRVADAVERLRKAPVVDLSNPVRQIARPPFAPLVGESAD